MVLLIAVAFVAGVATVLSPCVLPILPVVLASSTGGRKRPLALILGLVFSFALFTLLISQLVMRLGLSGSILRLAAVVIIGLLGVALIVPALNARLERLFIRLPGLAPQGHSDAGWRGGLLTGATLGLVWAPCAGPILAAVTTLAATQRANLAVALVAFAYAIGAGIPLLVIAYGGQAVLTRVPVFARHTLAIQKVFGGLMIVTALLIATNVDVTLSASAASLLPSDWSTRLTALETNPTVTGQLANLRGQPTPQPSNVNPAPAPIYPAPVVNSSLPNLGPAPKFVNLGGWINSEPLALSSLKGKVVMVDFWTYSCINCIRTLPYVTQWYEKYKDQGFVVIGVHSPEFSFEHDRANVVKAVDMYHITYPVAQDNSLDTWDSFNNLYWPAEYFIDAGGNLRYTHFGEGEYDHTEKVIQELLAEAGHLVTEPVVQPAAVPISGGQTPETYIGLERQYGFMSPQKPAANVLMSFTQPDFLPPDTFAVSGQWLFTLEDATATQAGDVLKLHFSAKDVYLVMTSDQPATVDVYIDNPAGNRSEDVDSQSRLNVSTSRLYHIVGLDKMGSGTVTLQFNQPGVKVYAFTFGS